MVDQGEKGKETHGGSQGRGGLSQTKAWLACEPGLAGGGIGSSQGAWFQRQRCRRKVEQGGL